MKKLHIFMLKSFAGPFVATFFISMFVLLMQALWRMIDELVGKGLDYSIITEFLFYVSITLVPMALPLAVLLASIMTFGSLGENYELIALKSAGISLYRIMKSLIVFIICLTIFAFFFSNNVLPVANLKMNSLYYDIRRQKPEMSFKEGIFTNDLEGYSIKVDRIDKESGMMYNLLIYTHNDGRGNYEVTKADSGTMKTDPLSNAMVLTLYNGHTYTDEGVQKVSARKTFPFRRLKFAKQVIMIDLPDTDFKRTDEDAFRSHALMLNLSQLQNRIDSVSAFLSDKKASEAKRLLKSNYQKSKVPNQQRDSVLLEESKDRYKDSDSLFLLSDPEEQQKSVSMALQYAREVKNRTSESKHYYTGQGEQVIRTKLEWHRKFSLSFACFIFFFIGAPLGAIIRKGGLGMPVVVSVFLFIIYYIIDMMGIRSAREAVILPVVGAWISSMVLLPLGILLTYKAVTDSSMMNIDAYNHFFKKIFSLFKKKDYVKS